MNPSNLLCLDEVADKRLPDAELDPSTLSPEMNDETLSDRLRPSLFHPQFGTRLFQLLSGWNQLNRLVIVLRLVLGLDTECNIEEYLQQVSHLTLLSEYTDTDDYHIALCRCIMEHWYNHGGPALQQVRQVAIHLTTTTKCSAPFVDEFESVPSIQKLVLLRKRHGFDDQSIEQRRLDQVQSSLESFPNSHWKLEDMWRIKNLFYGDSYTTYWRTNAQAEAVRDLSIKDHRDVMSEVGCYRCNYVSDQHEDHGVDAVYGMASQACFTDDSDYPVLVQGHYGSTILDMHLAYIATIEQAVQYGLSVQHRGLPLMLCDVCVAEGFELDILQLCLPPYPQRPTLPESNVRNPTIDRRKV
jgi:hypothetical protein